MGHQAILNPDVPNLLLITDSTRLPGEPFFDAVEAALTGGVDAVLVREKQLDSARLLAFASRLRAITREHGARLIIHSQADIAKAIEADGVHVATEDIGQLPAIRLWLGKAGKGMSFSASCHDEAELAAAHRAGADFALLSPVFPTASHPGASNLGVERFRELANTSPLPVVALGGITPENRGELAGFGVAVIGAILDSRHPGDAARRLA